MKTAHLIGAALAFAFTAAAAQDGDALQWQESNGVRYLCGGVGASEQQAMAQQQGWDLKLTFAARTGQYLADVDVNIRQNGNDVLSVRCDGPMMLVDLPHGGRYDIRASSNGMEQHVAVNVPARGRRAAVLRWPLAPDNVQASAE